MELKSLPDVAGQKEKSGKVSGSLSGLSWVGMEKIQMPILWEGQVLSAEVRAQVNLKSGTSRGIHMSRLYSLLSQALSTTELSWHQLAALTQALINSQGEISEAARIQVVFKLPIMRKALRSDLSGWRLYPVKMEVTQRASLLQKKLTTEVLYSSTCPASTALSLELWREDLNNKFAGGNVTLENMDSWFSSQEGMPGTPHAQRSRASVQVCISEDRFDWGPEDLIQGIEDVLKTPVQTAVKRIDEQEFARLNGQNTMFCEDAARKVQNWLSTLDFISTYRATFEHQESLHPHNAVAVIEKL